MPTINKPFLLKLVLVFLGAAGFLFGAHALQARRIPDALKQQSERADAAGKTDAAVHYLRQYLEFEQEDADALVKLIELLRTRNTPGRSQVELVFLYDRVLRLDPDRDPIRRDALKHCLKLGRFSDAVTHAEALLKKYPTEGAVWQQLGAAHVGMNELSKAREAYESAISRAPGDMAAYRQLAQLLWKNQNQPAEAKAVLDRMAAAVPQEPQAHYVRAKFEAYLADEAARANLPSNLEPALRDLRRVLELDPENADASLLLAEILQKGRDIPAAHAILRDAAGLYPRDLRLVRSLSWLELVRGNVPAAMAVLEDGLKYTPDGFDLLVPLADLLVQQGDTTRSQEILSQLEKRRAAPRQVKYLKARVAMRQEKWTEAVALLETLRTESFDLPGLEAQLNLLLATCFDKTGDPDGEEKALRRVTGADPAHVPARVGLATLFLNLGRFDDAARELETAVQSPYAPATVASQWVRLRAQRLRHGSSSPEDWRKLEQVAAAAAAKFGPVSSDAVILRADVACAQGKYADAQKILRAETARRPGDTRLWATLAECAANAKGTAAGLAVVDEAQAAAGDGPDIRLARATLYVREPGRVRPLDALTDRTDTWAEADQLRLLYGLADVYDQAGDRAKVVDVRRRIAARRPSDVSAWVQLHDRAADAGDAGAVAEARAALAKIEGPNGPSVLVCEAKATTDPHFAGRLLAVFGPSPNRADACLALAKLRAGDQSEALRLTERAFVLEPTRYEPARSWVALLCRTGDHTRAANVVARLASDPRWAGEPFRRMIGGVLERVPPDAAANLLTWCKPFVERDAGGLGWQAACLANMGKTDEAGAVLTAATQSPNATADDWFRLALHHAAGGRKDAADAALQAARAKLTPSAFFAVAAVYGETAFGKDGTPAATDAAEKRALAQARLAVKLSRSDQAGAVSMLETYLAEADLRPADDGWARRNLAMLLALSGSPENRQRATELLAKVQDVETTTEELRATASVLTTLARYLESAERKAALTRAATALEAVHKTSQSPRDLYNLSQLHRVAGNRPESRRCLQQLLHSDPKNIYYLVAALDELVDGREFPTAEAFAGRLRSLYPGEFRAVASVARYECKAGQPDRALSLAEGYAGAADAGAGDYLARSARVAELLDELARLPGVRGTPVGHKMADAAVERYSALVPTRPEAVVGITGVLAAEGRVADAFTKIDQLARYLPTRVRSLAGLAAVRGGGASDRQFDTVAGWIKDALAEEPGSVPHQLSEAEYLALRKDYPAAAAAYTKILDRNPRNVVALNNLAWMSAADPATAQRSLALIDRAAREAGLTGELLDTRARARITLKEYAKAEQDLNDALAMEQTALRWFHKAVLLQATGQTDEAAKAFREAKGRGLEPKTVHPSDLAVYKQLDAAP